MRILIINPILFTSETKNIVKLNTIKDTMIYDLCITFLEEGHDVTLYASDCYKPIKEELYPFNIIWGKSLFKSVFIPNCFPFMPGLALFLKQKENSYDYIITKEIFSMSSLVAVIMKPSKVIIWHELAKHNNKMRKIPSKIWYNVVVRLFYHNCLVIPCSIEARNFISKYCNKVMNIPMDHGVNLKKFKFLEIKDNYFVVCSQLIGRKKIDGILYKFKNFSEKYASETQLYIIGDGPEKEYLQNAADMLQISKKTYFLGKLNHEKLVPYLSNAKALLVNTIKDNNMISIIEAIAVGTPVVTTDIPYNASYVKSEKLGISRDNWNCDDLKEILDNNYEYVANCKKYRDKLSTQYKVIQFNKIFSEYNRRTT